VDLLPDGEADAEERREAAGSRKPSGVKAIPFQLECPLMGGHRRNPALMVPGVWMTKAGDIIPIKKDHASEAAELFSVPIEEGRPAAYAEGMLRVTIRDFGDKAVAIEGRPMTAAQRRNIRDWALLHGYGVEDHTSLRFAL
jgi:hypothetical protein